MTTVKFVGAYHVAVPESEWEAAIDCHGNREQAAEELETVALVELEVRSAPRRVDMTEFKQPHTECVPYNEAFFNLDTLDPIPTEQYSMPDVRDFRVAFHLHHYDSSGILETPFGSLRVGPLTDPPKHLAKKAYVFWD